MSDTAIPHGMKPYLRTLMDYGKLKPLELNSRKCGSFGSLMDYDKLRKSAIYGFYVPNRGWNSGNVREKGSSPATKKKPKVLGLFLFLIVLIYAHFRNWTQIGHICFYTCLDSFR